MRKHLKVLPAIGALLCAFQAVAEEPVSATTVSAKPPELQTTIAKNKDGTEGVILKVYIKADVEAVWDIIVKPDNMPSLFDSMLKVTLIQTEKQYNLWEFQLKTLLGKSVLKVRTWNDHSTYTAYWMRQEGGFSYFGGYWKLSAPSEFQGYTLLEYASFIDAGFFAPQFLTTKLNKKDAVKMADKLRARLEK